MTECVRQKNARTYNHAGNCTVYGLGLAGREYGRKEFDIPVKAILYFLFCPASQDRHILSDYFWYAYLIQILPAMTPAILSFDAARLVEQASMVDADAL